LSPVSRTGERPVSELSAATVTRAPGRSRSATARTAAGVSSTRTTIAVRPASGCWPIRPWNEDPLGAAAGWVVGGQGDPRL